MIADDHATRATLAGAAAEMRTDEPEIPTQDLDQRTIGLGIDLRRNTVEAKFDAWHDSLDSYGSSNFTMSYRSAGAILRQAIFSQLRITIRFGAI